MNGCEDQTGVRTNRSFDTVDNCIEYTYIQESILLLKHVNAGFNFCPVIETDAAIENGAITIVEREVEGLCDCYCLFDLYYIIVNLSPGEYAISVVEPYLQEGDETLKVTVDLEETPSGIHCLERNHSPWQSGFSKKQPIKAIDLLYLTSVAYHQRGDCS